MILKVHPSYFWLMELHPVVLFQYSTSVSIAMQSSFALRYHTNWAIGLAISYIGFPLNINLAFTCVVSLHYCGTN
jgi:hypothetical protein